MASEYKVIVPRRGIVKQREVELRPYTNCMIAAEGTAQLFGGLEWADQARMVRQLRKLTTIPEVDPVTSRTRGLRFSDVQQAIRVKMPWVLYEYGPWPTDKLLDALVRGTVVAVVIVQYNRLPVAQRRWSPNFTGRHAVVINNARPGNGGSTDVLFTDVLGLGEYRGDWVPFERIRPALDDSFVNGRLWCRTMRKGEAVSTLTSVARTYVEPATVQIPKGTVTVEQVGFEYEPRKKTTSAQTVRSDHRINVRQGPGRSPSGTFEHIITGPRKGQYVRTSAVVVTETPSTDCQAQIDAATLPLKQAIADQDATLAAIGKLVEDAE